MAVVTGEMSGVSHMHEASNKNVVHDAESSWEDKKAILRETVTHLIALFLSNGFPVQINSSVHQSSRIYRDKSCIMHVSSRHIEHLSSSALLIYS